MRIVVASGKGGTGKTTIAVALAKVLSSRVETILVDCDVEEPNSRNFLEADIQELEPVNIPLPVIDVERCTFCGICSRTCRYGALAVLKEQVMVFPELCNGCGACSLSCPEKAISYTSRRMGGIHGGYHDDLEFIEGRLDIGQAKAVPVIEAAKAHIDRDVSIIDSPPGSSCPVLEAARGSDIIVLVSEPTRFGMHDLRMVVDSLSILEIPMVIIINKVGIGKVDIRGFADVKNIPVIAEIPFDRNLSEVYARGDEPLDEIPWFKETIEDVASSLMVRKGGDPHQTV